MAISCSPITGPDSQFGAHYDVLLQPDPPVLESASLSVTVSYGGCGGDREFALRYMIRPSGVSIWLRKLSPEEACDMLVTERQVVALPDLVRGFDTVTLLMPNGSSHELRR